MPLQVRTGASFRVGRLLISSVLICALGPAKAHAGLEMVLPRAVDQMSEVVTGHAGAVPDTLKSTENKRWVAATLALFLGPFGAHRLYLGTSTKVPIIYGITFGGFGVLALIDLGHILFTKDLSRFEGDPRVFMWAKPKAASTPP